MKKIICFLPTFLLVSFAMFYFSADAWAETAFAPGVDYTSTNPAFIASGDLNNDVITDLIVANWSADTITVFLGNADGTFTAQPPVSTGDSGSHPNSIATGYFDADGNLDLAVANGGNLRDVVLMFGNGSGGFSSVTSLNVSVGGYTNGDADVNYIVSGDFDNDGEPDLALSKNTGYYDDGIHDHIKIMKGDGSGGFTSLSSTNVGDSATGPYRMTAGHFNVDVNLDLAVTFYDSGTLKILLGNGSGGFTEASGSPITVGTLPLSVINTDLNDDGEADLVVTNNTSNTLSILIGNGNGTFTAASGSPVSTGTGPNGVIAALIDSDEAPDLVVANSAASTFSVFPGNGDGTFQPRQDFNTGSGPGFLAALDFDGDGKTDIATANSSGNTLSVFLQPKTYVVTKTSDTNDGTCDTDCSLREAISAANTGPGGDTVLVPSGTYTITIGGGAEDANATGDFDITNSVTITGAGAGTTIIDGGGLHRPFHIIGAITIHISGVTIQHGFASDMSGYGGGIFVNGAAGTTVTVADSAILDNSGFGSGILNDGGGALIVTGTTVSGNRGGGGIYNNGGTLTVTDCTLTGNEGEGGGIANQYGTVTVINTTISGNDGYWGGGIRNDSGTLTVTNSTISGNTATGPGSGGIGNSYGTVTVSNSIVANQVAGNDCFSFEGAFVSSGHNIESGTSCGFTGTGDLQNTDPLLDALADNGGTTQTMALLSGSPAIDAGSCVQSADQRGVSRPQGNACDIGAYELDVPCVSTLSGMVSWWDGENDTLDIIGANHGTLQGGATFAAGKVGQAFSLDGVDDVVQVADAPSLNFSSASPLTIYMWAYPTAGSTMHLIGKRGTCYDSGQSANYQIASNSSGYHFNSGSQTLSTNQQLLTNQWQHVAFTSDGSTFRLYIDGQEKGSVAGTLGGQNNAPLIIGGVCDGVGATFSGLIDEVAIVNRALSSDEIAAIFNAGSSGTCAPDTTPDPFTFDPVTGASLSTPYTSDTITVSGINLPVGITVTGGEYSIGCTTFTTEEGTVVNGDTVCVRQTSSDSYSTMTTATLTIGEGSADFDVTTLSSHTVQVIPSGTVSTGTSVDITSNTGNIDCNWNGSSSSGTCISGAIGDSSEVVLTAELPAGTTVAWGAGCDSSTASTCTITSLTSNMTISPVTTAQTFTITVTGAGVNGGTMTGGGSISATWDGSATGGTDSEQVLYGGGPVSILATGNTGIYATWSGDCGSTDANGTGSATCTINAGITADKNILASFLEYPVRRFTTVATGHYKTIQEAYDNAVEGEEIQAQEADFPGDLNLNLLPAVTLRGGYNGGFASNGEYTTVGGIITFSGGPVTVERIMVQ